MSQIYFSVLSKYAFKMFTESHYSQTKDDIQEYVEEFETFTESHYSQTASLKVRWIIRFETFTESHYSQTPNTSLGFQSLSSHHQV